MQVVIIGVACDQVAPGVLTVFFQVDVLHLFGPKLREHFLTCLAIFMHRDGELFITVHQNGFNLFV